jgi:hypothetical protein
MGRAAVFLHRLGAAALFAWAGAAALPSSAAEPADPGVVVPARDDEIVERLPAHLGDPAQRRAERAAERAQRAQLQAHPDQLGLALQASRDALARGRREGDPRELGAVEAALAPWWNLPDPPPEVRLMRATVHQSQHEFQAALADLDALLASPAAALPVRAQAELTRSGVHQVLGRFDEAEAGCRRLAGPEFLPLGDGVRHNALACLAELSSLRGRADPAAATLARLAGAAGPDDPGDAPGWLQLMRAELAQRRGDPAAGALFEAALRASPDVYTQCAYADWLLDNGRPADALSLLRGHEAADPVLLRVALAERALYGPRDARTRRDARTLGERYDAALLRGDRSHGREQSRYELDLRGDRRAALALAESNWRVQREPADEVVLVRAAHAAGRGAAADGVWQFLRETGGRDARLAAGGADAAPFLPAAASGSGS